MITLLDIPHPFPHTYGSFLIEHGYEYKRDWDYKFSFDHGGKLAFTVIAEPHCPELETLLLLRYSEYITQ